MVEREDVKRVGVVLITATVAWRAPSTPTSSVRDADRRDVRGDGAEPAFVAVGKKGVSALTFRKQGVSASYTGFTDRPAFAQRA